MLAPWTLLSGQLCLFCNKLIKKEAEIALCVPGTYHVQRRCGSKLRTHHWSKAGEDWLVACVHWLIPFRCCPQTGCHRLWCLMPAYRRMTLTILAGWGEPSPATHRYSFDEFLTVVPISWGRLTLWSLHNIFDILKNKCQTISLDYIT